MDARRSSIRRLVLTAAGALAVAACVSPAGGPASRPAAVFEGLDGRLADLVDRLRPALVQIRTGTDAAHEAHPAAGFIVDAEGIVVSVAHAVSGGDRVDVELSDGRRLAGSVIGRDSRADLSVIRIEKTEGLPALRLGDSGRLRSGDLVLALGHPYGLRGAVSLGIVSGKGPPPEGGPPGFDFIYTDALISLGSSGGPLVNLAGEVIGVQDWAARNGAMGVAVPSDLVKLVLPRLIADGRVDWKAP